MPYDNLSTIKLLSSQWQTCLYFIQFIQGPGTTESVKVDSNIGT